MNTYFSNYHAHSYFSNMEGIPKSKKIFGDAEILELINYLQSMTEKKPLSVDNNLSASSLLERELMF